MAGASGGPGQAEQSRLYLDTDSSLTDESKDCSIECAICLQPSQFPVKLPCNHIFCFLCVKGISLQSKRCAMCRQEIPEDYIFNPVLVNPKEEEESKLVIQESEGDEYQWYYQGRQGWWQYDLRTSREIENHHKKGDRRCELLIAGYLYVIDFELMLQYRRNDPSRRRHVKRAAKATQPKKGVAGLRLGGVENCDNTEGDQDDDEDEEQVHGGSSTDDVTTTADSTFVRHAVTSAVRHGGVTTAVRGDDVRTTAVRDDVRTVVRDDVRTTAVRDNARTAGRDDVRRAVRNDLRTAVRDNTRDDLRIAVRDDVTTVADSNARPPSLSHPTAAGTRRRNVSNGDRPGDAEERSSDPERTRSLVQNLMNLVLNADDEESL